MEFRRYIAVVVTSEPTVLTFCKRASRAEECFGRIILVVVDLRDGNIFKRIKVKTMDSWKQYLFFVVSLRLFLIPFRAETCLATSTVCHNTNVTCSESDLLKIHWNLNGLFQEDPVLIEAIQRNILVAPDPLPLQMTGQPSKKRIMGQFN